jgi:hypothetical protein
MGGAEKKSKKQSDGKLSARQRQRDACTFYLDENLSECKAVHQVFEAESVKFERHYSHFPRDLFPHGAPDHMWLEFVGSKGWIVLTKDKSQRYNALEKAQIEKYRIRQFAFHAGNVSGEEMGRLLKAHLNKIFQYIYKAKAPFVVTLTQSGLRPKAL